MTAYFDQKHSKLRDIHVTDYEGLRTFEEEVVNDCMIAAEMPGMPADLRDAIHRTILDRAVNAQPMLDNGMFHVGADPENMVHHIDCLNTLVWDLHTVFHEVGSRRLDRFSDDPRTPLRCLVPDGEARQIELVNMEKAATGG